MPPIISIIISFIVIIFIVRFVTSSVAFKPSYTTVLIAVFLALSAVLIVYLLIVFSHAPFFLIFPISFFSTAYIYGNFIKNSDYGKIGFGKGLWVALMQHIITLALSLILNVATTH